MLGLPLFTRWSFPWRVSFPDNPKEMIAGQKFGGLILFCALWAILPLQGQEDVGNQALGLMWANRFHDAEVLWRQLEQRYPNNPAVHSNLWGLPWRSKASSRRQPPSIASRWR
jgi:hypothetical protein